MWTRRFFSICFSSFFIFISFYALTATLPTFVTDHLHGNQQQAGWVMTAFVIASVLMRPFAGRWMDGPARRIVLILSFIVYMLSAFAYPVISAFGVLLLLRFAHGLSFGAATTGNGAIVTELIPAHRKGEGLGYYTLAMNLAMVLGPFLGLTVIQRSSFNVLYTIMIVFGVLGLLFGLATAKSRRPEAASAKPKPQAAGRRFHWKSFLEPRSMPISLVALFLSIAYSGILSFVPGYAKELGLENISSYYFVVYAVMIVLARPFTGKLFDRFHRNVIVYPTLALYIVGLIVLATAHSAFAFLLSAALIGLGFGSLFPCLQTIAVQSAPPERTGLATGTLFIFFDGGIGIGSVLLGSVGSASSDRTMFLLAAVSVFVGLLVYLSLLHLRPASREAGLAEREAS
ncbi:MFS transporter [Cohnella zeiphila]|uniref:MFS transporter n=1 Tax=Cohnella zeiphila TaxID=2761120 RepID=UPI001EE1AC73|nr:MFS transporter [Cohnella zeiphila]